MKMKKKYAAAAAILGITVFGAGLSVMAKEPENGDLYTEDSYTKDSYTEDKIIKNKEGRIVGVDVTDLPPEVEYEWIDFEQLLELDQFAEYEKLGLTCDRDKKKLYFAGMEVEYLEDNYEDGTAIQYFSENGQESYDNTQINVTAVRDDDYHLMYFEFFRVTDDMSYWMDSDEDWFYDDTEDADFSEEEYAFDGDCTCSPRYEW